ncbi:MAG: FtsX-like permease family protein [Phycisphaerales bacterium]|nr:FtsX-like permease family protein [Phycisphaerales bacterium]
MFKTAIRFLIFDKPKSFGALFGTVLSVFLIAQQAGIFIFLINAMCSLVKNNNQFVWVVDNKTTNVNALGSLNTRIGNELKSIDGVKNVHALVVGSALAKFPNGISAGISLIGVEVPSFAGGPWNVYRGTKENIIADQAITTEYFDKKAYGNLPFGGYFEVNGKQVFNATETKGVRSFGAGLYCFTTIERARYLSNIATDKANAFLVELQPHYNQQSVIHNINETIYGVKAWNGSDFAKATVITVLKTSGIAISFGTLIVFAFIVGFVIIGLTLYSSAIDRIKDYGTLKAIGASNRYITSLIMTQATIIALLGYIIGTIMVELFRHGIAKVGTIFDYPLSLRIAFFLITLFIAISGSIFAVVRISKLEPAQVFRG